LITSADVGAGKSTITANLGILLAQIDRSVLLVDADLRRPVLHTLLQVPNVLGLSSYLSGRAMLEAVVTRTAVPKLSLMPSGPIPPNASDLLASRRMRDLLEAVAEQYDLVLLDSPPVLAVSDATTLAPVVDGILLVVGSGVPEVSLRRAKEQLEAVHGRILGAVVNQREVRRVGDRALDGLARVPQAAAAGLGGAGRAVAAYGAGVAETSHRAGHRAMSGLAGASRAGAARLGGAGRAVATLGAGVAGTSLRGLRHAGDRALDGLARMPQAAARLRDAGRAVATLGIAVAETSQRQLGYVRDSALRTTMTTALSGFATGLALVYIATGFLGWPAVPLDRTPPVTARASTGPGPRLAPSAKATSPPRGLASGPAVEVRHPSAASPASPPEVVAIRFGVIDRRQPDWTWSWRVTIHTPDDTARVNARIEYIEFQGSTRRLVGYEELCGLRLAHGRLESIEGIRTISAADSRRISTMTATVSAAAEGADSATCRPRSADGRTPLARGSQLGV
jgi:capsular exopolysaccharide synthesis family protein